MKRTTLFAACILVVLAGAWSFTRLGGRSANALADAPPQANHDFGFTAQFEAEVKKVGQITPLEFAGSYSAPDNTIAKISWDPTMAKHWDRFTLDPNDSRAMTPIRNMGPKDAHLYDFRLNPAELAIFKQKGFVVSERMGSHSFTDLYYRLYVRDLPVFVTSDSMLHAWHRFFDRMLEGLEADYFHPEFREMLAAMAAQVPAAANAYGAGPLAAALTDVDFFLAVARQLLDGSGDNVQGQAPRVHAPRPNPVETGAVVSGSVLGQAPRVQAAIAACQNQTMQEHVLFGRPRPIDFSQFKPRGRYDQTPEMQAYFKAVMWLGRIDFRIAGNESPEQDARELSGAIVLSDLLRRAGMVERWQQVDRALLRLIGKSDSLNFSQLGVVLDDAAIVPANVTPEDLAALRTRILDSKMGEQHIRGEWFLVNPTDPRKFELPRTFAFLGQRFALDSWALSKIVYDDIHWTDQATGRDEKVQRRIPSSLDVAFAVFGNNDTVPFLSHRMRAPAGKKFRDGLNYQHNLAAVRNLVERQPDSTWRESVYADWLGCLRELSTPNTGAKYPEAMRTTEWALKSTATQLASWTQLRHDTVLYVKPSYSMGFGCEYPAGFVEPIPHFWKRYGEMIERSKRVVAKSTFPDGPHKGIGALRREQWLGGLDKFAKASGMLLSIAEKEVAQLPLAPEEVKFLKDTVVLGGGSGRPPISGWYPNLFMHRRQDMSQDDAHKWVALVADVHTDPPFPPVGDPGCVVHQGVGNVDALVIAIDNGQDRMVYAGPVFSHYEFETSNAVRLTNADWHNTLRSGKGPSRPEWTVGFVVPGSNPDLKNYGKMDKSSGKEDKSSDRFP